MKNIMAKITLINIVLAFVNISIIVALARPIALMLGITLIIALLIIMSLKGVFDKIKSCFSQLVGI